MTPAPVDFGRVAHRPNQERPGVVKAVDAPSLPGFELNLPIRAPAFRPRGPKEVLQPYMEARVRRSQS